MPMSELAKTFEDIFPMPCVWCGKPIGAHTTDGKKWIQCGAEVKQLLEDSGRLAIWLIERPNDFRQPIRSATPNAD